MKWNTSLPPMYADERGLMHPELIKKIIGTFFDVYNELGHGFFESVYEPAFSVLLAERGIFFVAVLVWFRSRQIAKFRPDLLIEKKVIAELKSGRATEIEVGLLFNFGPEAQFRRFVFANERKQIRVTPR